MRKGTDGIKLEDHETDKPSVDIDPREASGSIQINTLDGEPLPVETPTPAKPTPTPEPTPEPEDNFRVAIQNVEPTDYLKIVNKNKEPTITVEVKNTGDGKGTQTVGLRWGHLYYEQTGAEPPDDTTFHTKEITLDPGETTTYKVNWEITENEFECPSGVTCQGDRINVTAYSEDHEHTVRPFKFKPPDGGYNGNSNISLILHAPDSVTPGYEYSLSAEVYNHKSEDSHFISENEMYNLHHVVVNSKTGYARFKKYDGLVLNENVRGWVEVCLTLGEGEGKETIEDYTPHPGRDHAPASNPGRLDCKKISVSGDNGGIGEGRLPRRNSLKVGVRR